MHRRKRTFRCVDPGLPLTIDMAPVQNIVQHLLQREIRGELRPGVRMHFQRSMNQCILPNLSVISVDKPPCILRKFTPDGKYLVAFSSDPACIELYKYRGVQMARDLLCKGFSKSEKSRGTDFELPSSSREALAKRFKIEVPWNGVLGTNHTDPGSKDVRDGIFSSIFRLMVRIAVSVPGEQMNRECSLFTEDSRYLILGSSCLVRDETSHPTAPEIYQNNESVEPNPRYPLENFTIYLVDLHQCERSDILQFRVDKIYLSHNQGIYLYNNTLAILSVQHQTIHLYEVELGKFRFITRIGRFCSEIEELLILDNPPVDIPCDYLDKKLNTLKQRLLASVFQPAYTDFLETNDHSSLTRFYQHFDRLIGMRIWKMQLLDEDHLLLKYASQDVVTLRVTEPNIHYCLFMVFQVSKQRVIEIYDSDNNNLVELFSLFNENFRNHFLTENARYCSAPSNNYYAMERYQQFRETLMTARFGGPVEAHKRILSQLPISAQSFTPSPYLDQGLFSYDDHRISVMERPKISLGTPIRFYGRDSGALKFEMHTTCQRYPQHASRRLVTFTFHPTDPFALSVVRNSPDYVLNFHVRVDYPSVRES